MRNPSKIKNKVKRTAMYEKYKQVKKSTKKQLKTERLNTLASILETPVDNFISKSLENVKQISVENTIYDYNHLLSTKNLIERYEQRLQELIKLNEKTLILIEKLNNNK
jgi:hypothetical protein